MEELFGELEKIKRKIERACILYEAGLINRDKYEKLRRGYELIEEALRIGVVKDWDYIKECEILAELTLAFWESELRDEYEEES